MSASMPPLAPVRASLPASPSAWKRLLRHREAVVLPALFVLAVTVFALGAPGFLSTDNLVNVSRQSVYLMIVALAQLVVLIGGGLDLSVGTVVALTFGAGAATWAGGLAAVVGAGEGAG